MKELRGKVVADQIKEGLTKDIEELKAKGINPTIAVVRVGENDSDISYERAIVKASEAIGLMARLVTLKEATTTEELEAELVKLNNDKEVHGSSRGL